MDTVNRNGWSTGGKRMVDPMHSDPGPVVGEAEHNDGRWCVLAPEHRKCRRCQGSVSHAQTRIRLQPDANEGPPGESSQRLYDQQPQ